MKLWIAAFCTTDESTLFDRQGLLVRAPDLSECAQVAENWRRKNPGLLSDEFEAWVSGVYELPQDAPANDPDVLFGPFSLTSILGPNAIYWRRGQHPGTEEDENFR